MINNCVLIINTYMQHVMKWPLYGSTIFTAKSAVAGSYSNNTDLCIAINQEGVYVLARRYINNTLIIIMND